MGGHVGWSSLSPKARAWRVGHATWSVVQMACLGYVWTSVAFRRRDAWTWASAAFLLLEGGALIVGRGNCPIGPLQEEWGDPVPFFELIMPPRMAKAAIPVLAGVSAAGIAGLLARWPGPVLRSHA